MTGVGIELKTCVLSEPNGSWHISLPVYRIQGGRDPGVQSHVYSSGFTRVTTGLTKIEPLVIAFPPNRDKLEELEPHLGGVAFFRQPARSTQPQRVVVGKLTWLFDTGSGGDDLPEIQLVLYPQDLP